MKKLIALFLSVMLIACVLPFSMPVIAETDERDGEIAIHDVYIEGLQPPVAGSTAEFSAPSTLRTIPNMSSSISTGMTIRSERICSSSRSPSTPRISTARAA